MNSAKWEMPDEGDSVEGDSVIGDDSVIDILLM